ncbi:MAG: hypothetical protein KAI27_01605 [Rhodospirillaceae bacterium]|nr:hypothetical protein [Rhodospirillaceae bacterium]
MALTARSFTSINNNLPSGHMPSGGRNIASVSSPQVEGILAKGGVGPEESFVFQDFTEQGFHKRRGDEPVKNTASNFEAPSSSFAYLIGQEQLDSEKSKTPQYGTASFRNVLSRAISAYENTAMVISGTMSSRGTSFSLSL